MPSHHTFALQHHWEWCLDTPCTCCGNQFGSGTSPKCQSSWWLLGVSQRSISKNPLTIHQLEQHIKLTQLLSIAGCTVHAWKLALNVNLKPFSTKAWDQLYLIDCQNLAMWFLHLLQLPQEIPGEEQQSKKTISGENKHQQVPHIMTYWTLPNSTGKPS